jgi:hypothetical protein
LGKLWNNAGGLADEGASKAFYRKGREGCAKDAKKSWIGAV